jgi:phosphopantothenoylcysteine decarboxylase/phosphopantothenate--cysteine ligase
MAQPGAQDGTWTGRKVLVGLGGGIACYKVCTVVSRLVQGGASVRVLMTESATRFVTPLTFQSLSGQPVVTSMWESSDHHDSQHIGLARWCDLMIIAPATADLIARLATGLCDNIVTLIATALPREGRPTPLLLAPAMNEQMWQNPITQRNVQTLRDLLGCRFVGPEHGWQACRTQGAGRMSEADAIVAAAAELVRAQS